MSTTYGTASSITIPSDGDTIDAADVNVPLAALWDQHDFLDTLVALKAILVPTHGLTRFVRGYGHYTFVTSGTYSASTAVSPWILAATDGTAGRWVSEGAADAQKTIVRSFACADGSPRGSTEIAKTHDMSGNVFWEPANADSTGADAGRAYYYFEGRQIKFTDANNAGATGKHVLFHLNQYLVHGANFDSLKLNLKGAGGHGALPAMMPSLALVKFDPEADTLVSLLAANTVDDASASTAAYDAVHSITLTPDQNTTISLTKYSYYAVVCNEGHTNALAELALRNLIITMTTAGYM